MKQVKKQVSRIGTRFVYACVTQLTYLYALTRTVEIGPRCDFSKVSGAKIAKPVNLEFRRRRQPVDSREFLRLQCSFCFGNGPAGCVGSKNTSYLTPSPNTRRYKRARAARLF